MKRVQDEVEQLKYHVGYSSVLAGKSSVADFKSIPMIAGARSMSALHQRPVYETKENIFQLNSLKDKLISTTDHSSR